MQKFNEKINKVKKAFNGIDNQKVNITANSAQINYLKSQINDLTDKIRRIDKGFETGNVLKYEAQLEKLYNQLNKIENEEEEIENKGSACFNSLNKGIDKVTSKIKRFALSLFSIRSIYALVSKASSSYLSQDITLANKLQAVWIGLGAMLEPIISKIANLMLKAVKYVNVFVKALTGVDLLAKATSKSLNGTTKSTKALSKALAGFDELTNLDTTTDTSSADTGSLDAFKNVEIDTGWANKIEKAGKLIKKWWKPIVIGVAAVTAVLIALKYAKKPADDITKVGTSFTGLFNSLGKATEIIAILGGLSLVIGQISGLITAFSESGLSLSDVAILLGTVLGELAIAFVAIAGATKLMDWQGITGAVVILGGFALVINQVSNLLKVFSETGMTVGDVAGLMATIFGTIVGLMGAIALLGPAMTAGLIPFSVVIAGISALLIVMAETIPTILDACSKFINNTAPSIQKILETIGNLVQKIIFALGTTLPPIIDSVGNLFSKIFSGISLVISTVGNTIVNILNTAKSLVTTVLSSILSFINRLGPAINNFVDNAITAVTKLINFLISGINYLVNTLIVGGVNKIIKAVNSVAEYVGITIPTVPKMSIPKFVPQLAVGTNYVPEDQLAYIHKGEAVVPKKFNSQEYFGRGNDETNSLLEQVIDAINNIDMHPYTTVKDVGRATVNYVREKERQTGRSVFA